MVEHKLRVSKSFADAIASGDRTFDVRMNGAGFNRGDKVSYEVVEDTDGVIAERVPHAVDEMVFDVTYVMSGYGIKEGFVVLALSESGQ